MFPCTRDPDPTGAESNDSPWKYFPAKFDSYEDLENYEPGGFHPVHLGDVYNGRFKVLHKLGHGGFSTVWLARDKVAHRWVSLKIVAARDSPSYETRSVIANHPSIRGSRLFAVALGRFWIDGPNGHHLCLIYPVLGPDLGRLSKLIYWRATPAFSRHVSRQAGQALAHLHSNGLCHGDFTAHNIVLRLVDNFDSYGEKDLLAMLKPPQTCPLITYSGKPPAPHAPKYIVEAVNFCFSTRPIVTSEICIIDFDQSFNMTEPPAKPPGIPAKYIAPEVAVGQSASPASDIWALGCAIYRIRSGDDLFFDYDTNCPADALQQIVKVRGELPEEWKQARFDSDGFVVSAEEQGDLLWAVNETVPLEQLVQGVIDQPPSLFIDSTGRPVGVKHHKALKADAPLQAGYYGAELREPYPPALRSILWRPTAVCVGGEYFVGYSDDGETDKMLGVFPRIKGQEASLLVDLLKKIFTYDPAKRLTAEEVIRHPWFDHVDGSG